MKTRQLIKKYSDLKEASDSKMESMKLAPSEVFSDAVTMSRRLEAAIDGLADICSEDNIEIAQLTARTTLEAGEEME